jgi:hypothetical protein
MPRNIYGGPFGPPIQQRPQPLGYLPLLVARILLKSGYFDKTQI